MKFDNQKTTIRLFLRKMLIAIIAAVAIVTVFATPWFRPDLLGITQYQWVFIIAGLYLLQVIVSWARDLNYLQFDDNGDMIIVRYYPIRPLGRKKKAVQIRKIAFAGYEIRKTWLGMRKLLILKQYVKRSVASYPPIGITSLTKPELEMLEERLSTHIH